MYKEKKVYEPPTMGLNDRLSPIMCDSKEAPVLENFEVNQRGVLDKVKGYTKDGSPFPASSDSFIRLLLNLKRGSSIDVLLMAAQDSGNTNSTYKVDFKKTIGDGTYSYIGHTEGTNASFTNANTAVTGVGTTWLSKLKAGDKIKAVAHADSAYTEIASVNNDTSITLVAGGYLGATAPTVSYIARVILNKSYMPRGVVFNNKAVITNGSDTPMTYDNTTLNLIVDADTPKAKYIEKHKNRIFMANVTGGPSNLYWSYVNDEQTWDASSMEPVFPQDNGNICSIKSFGDSLVVLKDNGNIYQVFGNFDGDEIGEPDFIRMVDSTENIGSISERTPVVHGGFLYFLAHTGFYRLDQRGVVEKVSFQIDNFINSISTTLGPSQSKSFVFDTKTQWDTGTHSGTKTTTGGTLQNYCEKYSVPNVLYTGSLNYSDVCIGSDNSVHIAYRAIGDSIVYGYLGPTDSSFTYETVITAGSGGATTGVCLKIAPNGTLGLLYSVAGTHYFYEKTSGGTWTRDSAIPVATPTEPLSYCLAYGPTNCPGVVFRRASAGTFWYRTRIAGVWTETYTGLSITSPTSPSLAIKVDGTPHFSVIDRPTEILYAVGSSTDGTSGWSAYDNVADASEAINLSVTNSSDDFITCYIDAYGVTKTRNHATTTTATVTSDADSVNGFTNYTTSNYNGLYFLDGTVEKIIYESSSVVPNSSTEIVSEDHTTRTNQLVHNGVVFATIAAGASVSEIVVRRIAPKAVYLSPIVSDSTLTAWGLFSVGSPVSVGGTLTYEIAVKPTSPPTTFYSINDGVVVNADPANVFAQAKVTIVLTDFSALTVGSIILNYTGAGVDAKQPVSFSFNNELYTACSLSSSTSNEKCQILDIANAFIRTTYPVSCFERFQKKLYAGLSSIGDLIILKQGYSFAGSSYTADFQSKEDFLGSIDLEKDIYKIYVLYEVKSAGTITFSYRLDNFKTSGGSTWKNSSIDLSKDGFYEILIGNKARTIQYRCNDSTLNGQGALLGWVLVYNNLNQR